MQVAARILWIAPSWLGDAVLSLPALRWLQASGVAVDVLARQGTERIFTAGDSPAVVHVVSATRRGQRLVAAWRLRPRAYAAAVVLPPSFSAALGAYAAGAPLRIGEQEGGRAGLPSHPLPPAGRAVHLALAYQRLAVARQVRHRADPVPRGWSIRPSSPTARGSATTPWRATAGGSTRSTSMSWRTSGGETRSRLPTGTTCGCTRPSPSTCSRCTPNGGSRPPRHATS